MKKNIALMRGDYSSPEIVAQAVRVLDRIAEKYGHEFVYTDIAMGGNAIDKYGDPFPDHELEKCLASDSVLLGAVGGPKRHEALCEYPSRKDLAAALLRKSPEGRDRGKGDRLRRPA